MGEKLKILSRVRLKNSEIEIELNKASKIDGPRSIHLQNDAFRLDMDEREFIKLAMTVLASKRKLLVLKGILK